MFDQLRRESEARRTVVVVGPPIWTYTCSLATAPKQRRIERFSRGALNCARRIEGPAAGLRPTAELRQMASWPFQARAGGIPPACRAGMLHAFG
jgi:hypothetical protein